jgi:hypothetical protein
MRDIIGHIRLASAGTIKAEREVGSRPGGLLAAAMVAAAFVAGLLFVVAPRAQANHIPGATYNGTAAGGTPVTLIVSADGSGITSFTATGPFDAGACTFGDLAWTYSGMPLPIINHAFSDTEDPSMSLSGSFPTVQGARGTLRVSDQADSCDTGDVPWSATTAATPPPPPDTTAPALALGGARSQRVLRQRGVVVVATPAEACTVVAKGTVVVRGSAKVFRFVPVTKQVGKGRTATLKLTLKRKALSAIGGAMRAGKRVSAKVTITAKDAAGNVTTKGRTIRLKR